MTSPGNDELISQFEVDIDFRPDSVRSMDEVTDLLGRARVQAEALSRASGDVVEHLREASNTPPIDMGSGATGGAGGGDGGGDGSGRLPPLTGFSEGIPSLTNKEVAVGADAGSESLDERVRPASSSPSEADINDRLSEVDSRDPDRIENMRKARGLPTPSPRGGEQLSRGVESFSDLAQNILQETRPGQSISGTLGNIAGGLGRAGTSGLGGLLGGGAMGALGVAGGAITAGLAGNAAVQAGGAQVQQYANMGSVQGGGVQQGISYEMGIRTMALNPFLTTEQSRQIVMSALSEGYSGDEFESVTDYMTENLTKMNMSVAQSTEILRKNVDEGGQSIQQLGMDLAALKSSTQGGVMSLEERTRIYQQTSGNLVDMGIQGDQASQQALDALELFEDDRALSGTFANIVGNISDPLAHHAGASAGIRGRDGYMMKQMMGDEGILNESVYQVLWRHANDIHQNAGRDEYDKKRMFNDWLRSMQMPMDPGDSNALYDRLVEDTTGTEMQEAEERFEQENYAPQEHETNAVGRGLATAGAAGRVLLQGIGDTLGMLNLGLGIEDETFASNFSEAYSSTGQEFQNLRNKQAALKSDGQIGALAQLNEEFGMGNVEVVDEDGKRVRQGGTGLSQEDMEALSSGEYKVSVNGRDPVDIRDARNRIAEWHQEDAEQDRLSGKTNVEVEISPTPELENLFRFKTRTANQEQANSGFGASTLNNPAPGDK